VDVEAFEEAAEAARRSGEPAAYRAALDLYVGDLLPENLYEGWKENRRRELRRLRIDLLIELAWLYEERGARESAVEAPGVPCKPSTSPRVMALLRAAGAAIERDPVMAPRPTTLQIRFASLTHVPFQALTSRPARSRPRACF
jgi:hypothetical protein